MMMHRFILFILLIFSPFTYADPLPVEQAFPLQASRLDATDIQLVWTMPKGYYLYQDRIHVRPSEHPSYALGQLQFPPPLTKLDKLGKLQKIYKEQLTLTIPVLGKTAGEATLQVQFQGCSDEGFCYPPQTQAFQVQIAANLDILAVTKLATTPTKPVARPTGAIESLFTQHYFPLILLSFFGFGVLLAFTPCVLPMIPVVSGIILSQGEGITPRQAFLLSLSYVLGLSVTYAVIGICFALLGSNLQLLFQSPWMHGFLAFILALLALSMFDFYELRPPEHWQNWFSRLNKRKRGGPYLSSAIMGSLSTLVLSPCVTAPLVGTLAYIANTGNLVLGGFALFFLGLGSGTPLLLISTSAARYLPKTGHWMYAIKAFFGLVLLTLALHLISDLLSPIITMALWGSLMLSTGIFIGALTPAYSSLERAKQSLGIICLLAGILIFIGASMGNTNPLQPLARAYANTGTIAPSSLTVTSLAALQRELKQHANQPVMLDFYADWCADCKYLEATTFQEPQLQTALKSILRIKIDVTKNNADTQALLKAYQVIAPPVFIFLNAQGQEIPALRIDGAVSEAMFIEHIHAAGQEHV